MGENSKIEWTHHTFNPWWGCVRVSPGCQHCYAETFAKRVGQKVWGVDAERRFFGAKHWNEPVKWNAAAEKAGERRRVFCASMADVLEDRRDLDAWRVALWNVIEITPALDWLLLTKRPENFDKLSPGSWVTRGCPPNVWYGTTVEDQRRADERIPALRRIPARVRFLSCEPLLTRVDFNQCAAWNPRDDAMFLSDIDWIIVGGESGAGARPMDLRWVYLIKQQVQIAYHVKLHIKQLGARPYHSPDHDGGTGYVLSLKDAKGGDWLEWPEELRIREYPS